MLSLDHLELLLAQFSDRRVGLVGDLFLDRYLEIEEGHQERSIETGIEAYQISRIRNQPGALGTIICNLAALGVGQILPLTVIGNDGHGFDLMRSLDDFPVEQEWILRSDSRMTPTYTKPMRSVDGTWQELNRIDIRTRAPLEESTVDELCVRLVQLYKECDGIIVLDQMDDAEQGIISSPVREIVQRLACDGGKLVYVDSRNNLHRFASGVLKENEAEIIKSSHGAVSDAASAVVELSRRTREPAICTMGENGSLIGFPNGNLSTVPGVAVEGAVDIVGAGDAATSGITLSLLSGASYEEAVAVGNLVASITVQQIGTTGTASPAQVLQRWHEWIERQ